MRPVRPSLARLGAVLAVVGLVAVGCGSGDDGSDGAAGAPTSTRPDRMAREAPVEPQATKAVWARGVTLDVYPEPGAAEPGQAFDNPNPVGAPLALGVVAEQDGWFQVQLPARPNGSTGWVRAEDVDVGESTFAVHVDVSDRWITVTDGGEVVREEAVAVGTPSTPTPLGSFFLIELHGPLEAGGPYGAYAFGVSAYSEVLMEFNGGPGQIALHGNGQPSTVGQAVSNGCIRLPDSSITWLADHVPVGTPVTFSE